MGRKTFVLIGILSCIILIVASGTQQVFGYRNDSPAAVSVLSTPAGTAFTYQGRLHDGGAPANGNYDLRFILYDAEIGGSQIGSILTRENVSVANGLFIVELDFSSAAFAGEARWLEVAVRPAGSGSFTTLSPRQALTPTPYTLHSLSTGALQGRAVSSAAPAAGQVLKWDGDEWAPAADEDTTYGAGTGLTLDGSTFNVDFAGSGRADTAARSDHDHDGVYAPVVHDHDDRYYTQSQLYTRSQLQTSGQSQVNWDNLTNVPPDFADGVDNDTLAELDCGAGQIAKQVGGQWQCADDDDTTYTAGPGLSLSDNQFSVIGLPRPGFAINQVDTASAFDYSAIIGADGLALISYTDNSRLKVAHCEDLACSSATVTTLDGGGPLGDPDRQVGWRNSITIGSDGLGLISYYNVTSGRLKVAKCNNLKCTSATITTLDNSSDFVGRNTSIATGSDGMGIIAYQDRKDNVNGPGDLKVAHCSNIDCTSATITTLDTSTAAGASVGSSISIAIGSDGLPLIAYLEGSPNNRPKIARCSDVRCTSFTLFTPLATGTANGLFSLAIGSDGFGLLGFRGNNSRPRIGHCSDLNCSAMTFLEIETGTASSLSFAIGSDGLGVLSYHQSASPDDRIKVAHCSDIPCTAATHTVAASSPSGNLTGATAITIGADGLPLVLYRSRNNGRMNAAHCSNRLCVPHYRPR